MPKPIVRDLETISRLKQVKKAHGFNLSQLAAHLHLNKGLVSQVLSGKVQYSAKARAAVGLPPLPEWRPVADSVPRDRIIGGRWAQCPECAALHAAGQIADEADTWWHYGAATRVYCSAAHGRAYRQRLKQNTPNAQPALSRAS